MKLTKIAVFLLAGVLSTAPVHTFAATKAGSSSKTHKSVTKVTKDKVIKAKAHGSNKAKTSKVNVKTSHSKSTPANIKNETKALYGVKGAQLKHVKVSDSTRTYKEKGKYHKIIGKEASRQYSQTGIASYYGGKFHGRKTANGEIYDKYAYTAAHKTLALGSYALVTNLNNGRKLIVRINDRGPYSKERIIDLSKGAARELGMIHSGTARVRIEAMQVDKDGYISGKAAHSLAKLAKQEGLPLKIKGEGDALAIKADSQKLKTPSDKKVLLTNKPHEKVTTTSLKVIAPTEKEAKKVALQVKQKTQISKVDGKYEVNIAVSNKIEGDKVKKQISKLNRHQIVMNY
ncbi:hypothetical protein BMT54_07335 [Pasteurellaceae bacterium 15-036681]|nr:hypothetical protein BMT54_07335 [Pasteurellaceae bacterium 15-036681]